MVIEEITRYQG